MMDDTADWWGVVDGWVVVGERVLTSYDRDPNLSICWFVMGSQREDGIFKMCPIGHRGGGGQQRGSATGQHCAESDSTQTYTAWSFATKNFACALKENITFFLNICELFQY